MLYPDQEIFKEFTFFTNDIENCFPLNVYSEPHQEDTVFHQHDFVELVLILSGHGNHQIPHSSTVLRRGDICIIPRGCIHGYSDTSDDFCLINLLFLPEKLPMPRLDAILLPGFQCLLSGQSPDNNEKYVLFHLDDTEFSLLEAAAQAIIAENSNRGPGSNFIMLGYFMSLLGKLAQYYSRRGPFSKYNFNEIATAIAYLNRHVHNNITIAKLCSLANMSRASFMRNFKQATGLAPLQYQLRLRLGEAAMLLQSTNKSLGDIASEVGFSDINYFGRQFKKILSTTPAQYRKKFLKPNA